MTSRSSLRRVSRSSLRRVSRLPLPRVVRRLATFAAAAAATATAAATLAGCGGDSFQTQARPVLENYATNLYQAYSDAVTDEQDFSAAVDAFVAAPTEANLAAARQAWIDGRAHYMVTEGARFYDGPIDIDPPNHESSLNSWPLDEAYIDYTFADATAGFVNNPSLMQNITIDAIDAANAQGGDENISDGYHAIEFLLWGQATADPGPGKRPATDYDPTSTALNVDRRIAYLKTATQAVIQHLTAVRDQWAPGQPYRTMFVAGGKTSVADALSGMGKLSKGELAGERINAPYTSKSRHDQHDCFSSLTLIDYQRDAQGILDLYNGNYTSAAGKTNDGPGFDTLVKAKDAGIDATLQTQLQASVDAIKAIYAVSPYFENDIAGDDSSPGRMATLNAVNTLRAQGDDFAEAGTALGLKIEIPLSND